MDAFDYVIVGAGSAGCVLARRLVDAGHQVCLLESGPSDRSPFIHLPAGFVRTLLDPSLTWRYKADGGESLPGRRIPIVHGRVLGGSSAVNGMIWVRGQARDFDGWAALGNPGWRFDEVLPLFRRIERRIGESDPRWRGTEGPVPVTDSDWRNPLCDAFIAAAHALGVPANPDTNGSRQDGAGYYQRNIVRGRRISAARAWLDPVRSHPALAIRTGAHATELILEGSRVVGVRYAPEGDRGTRVEVRARVEVIVCAGSVGSPRLLQISGIGPPALLASIGVPVRHASPGVGENLQDHFSPRVITRVRGASTLNELARGPRLAIEALKWATGRPSILGLGVALAHAFCRSDPALASPDVVVMFTPGSYKGGVLGNLDDFPGVTCGGWQLRPHSRGFVRVRSPDPFQFPAIQPNYLADARDQAAALWALKMARRIMGTEPMARHVAEELAPGPGLVDDDALLDYARRTGTTTAHLVGTCRMGPDDDPSAVVDAQLRVRGVQSLRVVDASVMPTITSGNTHAPTLMIAEKAADLILGRAAA
jgi:choline dehydrogenase